MRLPDSLLSLPFRSSSPSAPRPPAGAQQLASDPGPQGARRRLGPRIRDRPDPAHHRSTRRPRATASIARSTTASRGSRQRRPEQVPGAMNVRTVFTSGADGLRGHERRPVQVRRRRGLPAGRAGPGGDPKNPKKLNTPVQAVFTGWSARCSRASPAAASTELRRRRDLEAARAGQRHGALRERLEPRLLQGRPDLRRHQSGIYVSLNFGSTWTLASDGISGITLRMFADDKCAEHLLRLRHRRRVPHDQRRHHVVEHRGPDRPPARRRPGARAHPVLRRQREAPLRRHRERRLRRHDRQRPAAGPGQLAQGRPTTASATTRSSGR